MILAIGRRLYVHAGYQFRDHGKVIYTYSLSREGMGIRGLAREDAVRELAGTPRDYERDAAAYMEASATILRDGSRDVGNAPGGGKARKLQRQLQRRAEAGR